MPLCNITAFRAFSAACCASKQSSSKNTCGSFARACWRLLRARSSHARGWSGRSRCALINDSALPQGRADDQRETIPVLLYFLWCDDDDVLGVFDIAQAPVQVASHRAVAVVPALD